MVGYAEVPLATRVAHEIYVGMLNTGPNRFCDNTVKYVALVINKEGT